MRAAQQQANNLSHGWTQSLKDWKISTAAKAKPKAALTSGAGIARRAHFGRADSKGNTMDTTNWVTTLNSTIKNLLSGNSSQFLSFGLAIASGLAIILIVRYGITTALSGRAFDFGDFFQEVILLVGACLCILRGYSTPMGSLAARLFLTSSSTGPASSPTPNQMNSDAQLERPFSTVLTAEPRSHQSARHRGADLLLDLYGFHPRHPRPSCLPSSPLASWPRRSSFSLDPSLYLSSSSAQCHSCSGVGFAASCNTPFIP